LRENGDLATIAWDMTNERMIYLTKAQESFLGAQSEFANGRYNNCANRCYYSCLQAARAALHEAGIKPDSPRMAWGHEFIQARFVGELINRRKRYPTSLRDTLARTLILRQLADYEPDVVSRTQAERSLRRSHEFLSTLLLKGGGAS